MRLESIEGVNDGGRLFGNGYEGYENGYQDVCPSYFLLQIYSPLQAAFAEK